MKEKKEQLILPRREMNFELLRVFAMLMIISLHYWGKSGYIDNVKIDSPSFFLAWLIRAICFCAVNCYVLLTGYFMSLQKFKVSKVVKIWLQVFEYSITVYVISCFFGINVFSTGSLVKCFFPVTTEAYWFVTKYILLVLITPFLNYYISFCNKKQLGLTCVVFVCLFSLAPTFLCFCDFANLADGYSVIWFTTLYLIAAYIRLYGLDLLESKKICLVGFCVNTGLLFFSKIIIYLVTSHLLDEVKYTNVFFRYNSIFVFMSSLLLFGLFKNIKIVNEKICKLIGFFSPAMLGVYLLHLSPSIKDWFWKEVVNPTKIEGFLHLLLHYFVTVLTVFLLCSLVELLRKIILEKSVIMTKLFEVIDKNSHYFYRKIIHRFDV